MSNNHETKPVCRLTESELAQEQHHLTNLLNAGDASTRHTRRLAKVKRELAEIERAKGEQE